MTAYIFKSSLSLIILFGLYWFLLRNEKLFVFNRYFLVLSVVFSLTIPFLSLPVNFQVTPRLEFAFPVPGNIIGEISEVTNNQQYTEIRPSAIDNSAILLIIYVSGVLLFLFRLLRNIYVLIRKIKISEKICLEGYRIVLTQDKGGPCCFFHTIFMNRDDYLNDRIDKALLKHEKEHARQSHTIDILLIELFKIFYWFNPVYLLYDRAIRINHEYLADYGVIGDKSDIKNYAEKLLSFVSCKSNFSLASSSTHSFTKKRLTMMMKSKSKGIVTGTRIIIALSIGLILFLLLSFKESENLLSAPVQSEDDITAFRNDSLSNINTHFTSDTMEDNSKNLQVNNNLSDNIKAPSDNTKTQSDNSKILSDNSKNPSDNSNTLGQDSSLILFDYHIVTLRPGVKMGQYVDFLKTKFVSEYNKNFPGSKLVIACRDTWLNVNRYALFYYFESWNEYRKYYPGKEMSAECKAAWEKTKQSIKEEENKYIIDKKRDSIPEPSIYLPPWFNKVLDSLDNIQW